MGKKAVLLLASALLVLGMALPAAAGPFQDVPADHWAYDAVAKLVAAGLVEGFPDGTFKGERSMNRYQFAQIIARMVDKLDRLVKDQVQLESAAAMKAAKEAQDLAAQALEAAKSAKDPEAMKAATAALERAEAAYQAALAAQAKADAAFDAAGGARETAESAQAAADTAAQIAQEAKALAEKAAGVKPTEVVKMVEKPAPTVDLTPLEKAIAKLDSDKVSNQAFVSVMGDADLAVATLEELLPRVDAMEQDLKARQEAEAALVAKVADIEKTIKDLLVEFKDDLANQNVKLSKVQDLIDQLDGRVAALEDEVAALKAATAALDERTTALENKAKSLDDKTAALDQRIGKSEDRIRKLEDDVTVLKVRTSTVEDKANATEEKLDKFIAEHEKLAFNGSTSVVFTDAKRLSGAGTMYADPVNDYGDGGNVISDESTFQQKLTLGMSAKPADGVLLKGSLSLVNNLFYRGEDSVGSQQRPVTGPGVEGLSLDLVTDGALKSVHFGVIDAAAAADGFPKAVFSAKGFGYDPDTDPDPATSNASKNNSREGGMAVISTGPVTTKVILSRFVLDAHVNPDGTVVPASAEYVYAARSALTIGEAATIGASFVGDRKRNYDTSADNNMNQAAAVDLAGKLGVVAYNGVWAHDYNNQADVIDASGSAKLGPATMGVSYSKYDKAYNVRFQEPWMKDTDFYQASADPSADWNPDTTKIVASVSVPVWMVTLSGEYGTKGEVVVPENGTVWQKGQVETPFLGGTVKSYIQKNGYSGTVATTEETVGSLEVYAGLEKAKLFNLVTFTAYVDHASKDAGGLHGFVRWADASMPFKLAGLPLELAAEYGLKYHRADNADRYHLKGSIGIKDWRLGDWITVNAGVIKDQHPIDTVGDYTSNTNVLKFGGDISLVLFKSLKATGSYWLANITDDVGGAISTASVHGLDLTYPVAGVDLTAGAKYVAYTDKITAANSYTALKLNAGLSYSF